MNDISTVVNSSFPTSSPVSEITQNNDSPMLGTSDIISIVSLVFTAILTIVGLAIAWRQWRDPIKDFFQREKNKRKSSIATRGIGRKREFVQLELGQLAKSKKTKSQIREIDENVEQREEVIE